MKHGWRQGLERFASDRASMLGLALLLAGLRMWLV